MLVIYIYYVQYMHLSTSKHPRDSGRIKKAPRWLANTLLRDQTFIIVKWRASCYRTGGKGSFCVLYRVDSMESPPSTPPFLFIASVAVLRSFQARCAIRKSMTIGDGFQCMPIRNALRWRANEVWWCRRQRTEKTRIWYIITCVVWIGSLQENSMQNWGL